MLKSFALGAVALTFVLGAASAEQMRKSTTDRTGMDRMGATTMNTDFLTTLPTNALLVSNIYSQNVYDPSENKIGEVKDIIIDRNAAMTAAIISVGGFLGIGEKDVAVDFNNLNVAQRNNKTWLTMNTTKDALKGAAGFKFDKAQGLWTLGQN